MSNSLAISQNGSHAVETFIDQEKRTLLANTLLRGATDNELALFVNLCNAKRLDPFTRQIYGIKTGNGGLQMFASIDGLRVIAQRSGQYAGQMGPFWCGTDGQWTDVWLAQEPPAAAKVGVLRKGWPEPMWGVATMASYGKQSPTWKQMPDMMLAKCAESVALRKAFPDDISGLYVREEFGDAETPELQHNAPMANVTPLRATPVVAEVVDQGTGEIQPTKEDLGASIKSLRELLGWTQGDVRAEAQKKGIDLRTLEGLQNMVDVLAGYGYELEHGGADEAPDGEPEQPTLLDADVAPVDRWADD